MFATFVARHQLLVFPFAAYTHDHNFEYQPAALGYGLQEDFRGRYSSTAGQLFVAYGITDWLALELESSDIRAHFEKSRSDTSATPARINESGIADFSGQVRLRLGRERGRRPEFFAGIEILPPSYRHRVLIGEPRWDVKGEIGATRGYRWGTMTFRTTIEYNHGDTHWDVGETSIEYLRQVSRTWRLLKVNTPTTFPSDITGKRKAPCMPVSRASFTWATRGSLARHRRRSSRAAIHRGRSTARRPGNPRGPWRHWWRGGFRRRPAA